MFWQVFAKGVDKDAVVLMAARASRLENQDAIDTAIVSMLGDPKEVSSFTQVSILVDDIYTLLSFLFFHGDLCFILQTRRVLGSRNFISFHSIQQTREQL